MSAARPVIFITDYGTADPFAGVCRAVIEQQAPGTRVIDLTHGVPAGDIEHAARVINDALPHLPLGVVLGVVDPGVGGARRAIAAEAGSGHPFVGPDNGMFWPALASAGGARLVIDIGNSPLAAASPSATFHGRDIFAPVAAALARGVDFNLAGEQIDPASLVRLELSRSQAADGLLSARVVEIDGFGNVRLDAVVADLLELEAGEPLFALRIAGSETTAPLVRTFGDVEPGRVLLFADANGALAIAINAGSAARELGLSRGADVLIEPVTD